MISSLLASKSVVNIQFYFNFSRHIQSIQTLAIVLCILEYFYISLQSIAFKPFKKNHLDFLLSYRENNCCVFFDFCLFSHPQNKLMKTIRFFRSFLTAILKLCALKRTHLISSLCYPEQYGFTPPAKTRMVVQLVRIRYCRLLS